MTTRTMRLVICDTCGAELAAGLHQARFGHGWRRLRTLGGAMQDACPACADDARRTALLAEVADLNVRLARRRPVRLPDGRVGEVSA